MKLRYTFLNYMANMIYWGVFGVLGIGLVTVTLLILQNSYPLWDFFMVGMSYYMLPSIVIGAVSTLIISLVLILLIRIFFPIPNPESSKFQFFTLMIVSATSFLISCVGWNIDLPNIFPLGFSSNFALRHIIPTSIVLTFVHYRALPHMFGTVQKRKEK